MAAKDGASFDRRALLDAVSLEGVGHPPLELVQAGSTPILPRLWQQWDQRRRRAGLRRRRRRLSVPTGAVGASELLRGAEIVAVLLITTAGGDLELSRFCLDSFSNRRLFD